MNALTRPNDFLDALRQTALGAQIDAEIRDRAIAERQAIAEQLDALNKRAADEFPRHVEAVEKAIATVRKAEQALVEARAKLDAANYARSSFSQEILHTRNDLEAALAASASPLIDEFIAWCRDDLELSRRAVVSNFGMEKHRVTGELAITREGNGNSINRRLAALFKAIDKAAEMRLFPDQSAVPAALAKIKAELPRIEGIAQ